MSLLAKNLVYYLGFKRGPKPGVADEVNRSLSGRGSLNATEWFTEFWKRRGIDRRVSDFVYERFPIYTGLDFSRVIPTDRIADDLKFRDVSRDDWEFDFHDEFESEFGVGILYELSEEETKTVEGIVRMCDRLAKGQSPH